MGTPIQADIHDVLYDDAFDDVPQPPSLAEALIRCPRGKILSARHQGVDLVVGVLSSGYRFAALDRCPHDGGLLSTGFLDGDRLVCARHGWEFDVNTGTCSTASAATIDLFPLGVRAGTNNPISSG